MSASDLKSQLEELVAQAREVFESVHDSHTLNQKKATFVGKSGALQGMMRHMRDLSPSERPAFGELVNNARDRVQELLDEHIERVAKLELQRKMDASAADATLPPRITRHGGPHPLRMVEARMIRIFRDMGYSVARGPEVETDFHNFTALNFPDDHPARDMHDTLMVEGEDPAFGPRLLRTHTSPVQVRTMLANQPPVRIVAPGAVYRSDEVDATHSPCFNQIEGLLVDEHVTLAQLKGTLAFFLERFFGKSAEVRFRPSYFPFTEPSVEVDVQCVFCEGAGCRTCKQTGWIEILGAGIVDPNVLKAAGVDTDRYSGFAFGMGIERIAMLMYGVDDIRHFYDNDVRFLAQFSPR